MCCVTKSCRLTEMNMRKHVKDYNNTFRQEMA